MAQLQFRWTVQFNNGETIIGGWVNASDFTVEEMNKFQTASQKYTKSTEIEYRTVEVK